MGLEGLLCEIWGIPRLDKIGLPNLRLQILCYDVNLR